MAAHVTVEALLPIAGPLNSVAPMPRPISDTLIHAQRMLRDRLRAPEASLSERDRAALSTLSNLVGAKISDERRHHAYISAAQERIESAIADRRFRTVYQPIIDLASGDVSGFEALSRFDGGDPSRWFADAYLVGLRTELELASIENALSRALEGGIPGNGFLSVNASPHAILAPGLRSALEDTELPLDHIVLEVTEDAPVDDFDAVRRALAPLRSRGLKLAVDDTGSGYSSLKVILQLRPDFIKFDRFFVNEIENDPGRRALFAASVEFAMAVGGKVVAEGIETEAQLDVLRSLGVHLGQGYFLGRPRPLSD